MNNRLDTILQNIHISSSHETEGETVEQDIMNNFPIDNIEDLEKFEKLLIDGQINRQKLVSVKIGKIEIHYVCVLRRCVYINIFYKCVCVCTHT